MVVGGLNGTHKNWWECDTGIAYLVSGDPDWRSSRMTQIYDLCDPAKPVFIRDFGLPGQQPGIDGTGADRAARPDLHRPEGQPRLLRLRHQHDGILQIVDREKLLNGPKEPTATNLLYPQIARVDLLPTSARTPCFRCSASSCRSSRRKPRPAAAAPRDIPCDRLRRTSFIAIVRTNASSAEPADGVDCRHHRRDEAVRRRRRWTVPEASGNFCDARRPLRHAFVERELHADLLQAASLFFAASTPACAPSTSATRTTRRKSGITFPPITERRTSGASARGADGTLQEWRSRPTTSRWTIAATSIARSTARTPACTSSS